MQGLLLFFFCCRDFNLGGSKANDFAIARLFRVKLCLTRCLGKIRCNYRVKLEAERERETFHYSMQRFFSFSFVP